MKKVKTLIVSEKIFKFMRTGGHLRDLTTFAPGSVVAKVGYYGDLPVYMDQTMPDDKVLVTYEQDYGANELQQGMVNRWREELRAVTKVTDRLRP